MSSVKITNIQDVRLQIRVIALREINKIIKRHLLKDLEKEIINTILRRFRATSIYRGIKGSYPGDETRDYQAIFGLTDILARQAIKDMEYIFRNYVTIDLAMEEKNTQVKYILKIKYPKLNDYFIGMASGSYTYDYTVIRFRGRERDFQTEQLEIPWMNWFINGEEVEASIDWDLSEKDMAVSRSQRAVMKRTTATDAGWEWDGIDIAEVVINNPKLKNALLLVLNSTIIETINNNLGKI
jgi:hypothetical protein